MSYSTKHFSPGERVRIVQPKTYGTGPSDTETTTHYGEVDPSPVQTPDRGRLVNVRIDSGAVIAYPVRHVFAEV